MPLWIGIGRLTLVVWLSSAIPTMAAPQQAHLLQLSQIDVVAVTRPCLATALLFLGAGPTDSKSGILRLTGIPTRETVLVLTDKTGAAGRSPQVVTEVSPYSYYSEAEFLVEVRWSLTVIDKNAFLFATQAQIVDGLGAPIVPSHIVEPLTVAVVADGAVRILGAGAVL